MTTFTRETTLIQVYFFPIFKIGSCRENEISYLIFLKSTRKSKICDFWFQIFQNINKKAHDSKLAQNFEKTILHAKLRFALLRVWTTPFFKDHFF